VLGTVILQMASSVKKDNKKTKKKHIAGRVKKSVVLGLCNNANM
jgi:hypothetical protein